MNKWCPKVKYQLKLWRMHNKIRCTLITSILFFDCEELHISTYTLAYGIVTATRVYKYDQHTAMFVWNRRNRLTSYMWENLRYQPIAMFVWNHGCLWTSYSQENIYICITSPLQCLFQTLVTCGLVICGRTYITSPLQLWHAQRHALRTSPNPIIKLNHNGQQL